MKRICGTLVAALVLSGCASQMLSVTDGISGDKALGKRGNPVKADMPPGQRAYLNRLRCSDGSPPSYTRSGSLGAGRDNHIVDSYAVDCGDAAPGKVNIIMDMYHPRHIEKQAVAGFTIVGPE